MVLTLDLKEDYETADLKEFLTLKQGNAPHLKH